MKHMRSRSTRSLLGRLSTICLITLLLSAAESFAEIEIVLKNSFIEKYKNRVAFDGSFDVDVVPAKVHAAKDDGDIHLAVRNTEIGLPMVAEIMNAKEEKAAINAIRQVQGSGE